MDLITAIPCSVYFIKQMQMLIVDFVVRFVVRLSLRTFHSVFQIANSYGLRGG